MTDVGSLMVNYRGNVTTGGRSHYGNVYYTFPLQLPEQVQYQAVESAEDAEHKLHQIEHDVDYMTLSRSFVGREKELNILKENLLDQQSDGRCIFTVMGMSGIGKTQLCLKFAHIHSAQFDAVLWIDAASRRSMRQSLARWAENFFENETSTYEDNTRNSATIQVSAQIARVRGWLSRENNRNWLMILHNADRDYGNGSDPLAYDLADFLPEADHGTILVSTQLANMPFNGLHIDMLDNEQSLAMLQSYACGRTLTDAEPLLRQLGGQPLALAQAGAYLGRHRNLSASDYLHIYENKWQSLMEDRNPYLVQIFGHRSVLITWSLSYDRVAAHNPSAAGLVCLWAFLDRRDIWFGLIESARKKQYVARLPEWYENLTDHRCFFREAIMLLQGYSLINISIGGDAAFIHPVLHSWNRHQTSTADDKEDLYHLAFAIVAGAIPEHRSPNDAKVERRLLPHAVALQRADDRPLRDIYGFMATERVAGLLWRCSSEGGSRQLWERALDIHRKVNGSAIELSMQRQSYLASLYRQSEDRGEAEELFLRTISGLASSNRLKDWRSLAMMHNLAFLYAKSFYYAKAEALYRIVLARQETQFGPNHESVLLTTINLADLMRVQRRLAEAKALAEKCKFTLQEQARPSSQMSIAAMYTLALIYRDQNNLDHAVYLLKQVLRLREAVSEPEFPEIVRIMIELGLLYRVQQDTEQAVKTLRTALSKAEETLGIRHRRTADAAWWLSTILHDQGDLKDAEVLALRCAECFKETLGGDHLETILGWQWVQKLKDQRAGREQVRAFCDKCGVMTQFDDIRLVCLSCYGGSQSICEGCAIGDSRCIDLCHRPRRALLHGKWLLCSQTGEIRRDYRCDILSSESSPRLPQEQQLPPALRALLQDGDSNAGNNPSNCENSPAHGVDWTRVQPSSAVSRTDLSNEANRDIEGRPERQALWNTLPCWQKLAQVLRWRNPLKWLSTLAIFRAVRSYANWRSSSFMLWLHSAGG